MTESEQLGGGTARSLPEELRLSVDEEFVGDEYRLDHTCIEIGEEFTLYEEEEIIHTETDDDGWLHLYIASKAGKKVLATRDDLENWSEDDD